MTNATEQLIQRLANDAAPARPLPAPWVRTGIWLSLLIPYIAVVLLAMIMRNGLPGFTPDARFIIEIVSGLAAGIAAALCAFRSVVPAYSRWFFVVFVVLAGAWLGSVGQNCVQEWLRNGSQALSVSHDLSCLPFITFASIYPAIALIWMLRRGAPLTPRLTAAVTGMAAAGLANFVLRIVFPEDANVGLLVWHIGGVFLLAAITGAVGHWLLNWRSIAGASNNISR